MLSILNGAYVHTSQNGRRFYLDYAPDSVHPLMDLTHLYNILKKFELFKTRPGDAFYPYVAVYNNRRRKERLIGRKNIFIKYIL
jgi:hypothetical protein